MRAALDRIQHCLNEIQDDIKANREMILEVRRIAEEVKGAAQKLNEIKGQLHQQSNFLTRFAALNADVDRCIKDLAEVKGLLDKAQREVARTTNPQA